MTDDTIRALREVLADLQLVSPLPWESDVRLLDNVHIFDAAGNRVAELETVVDATGIVAAVNALPSLLDRLEQQSKQLARVAHVCEGEIELCNAGNAGAPVSAKNLAMALLRIVRAEQSLRPAPSEPEQSTGPRDGHGSGPGEPNTFHTKDGLPPEGWPAPSEEPDRG